MTKLTLVLDDRVVSKARRKAEAMGTSVRQLVRNYLQELAGETDGKELARAFRELSERTKGTSGGWKFDREELHER